MPSPACNPKAISQHPMSNARKLRVSVLKSPFVGLEGHGNEHASSTTLAWVITTGLGPRWIKINGDGAGHHRQVKNQLWCLSNISDYNPTEPAVMGWPDRTSGDGTFAIASLVVVISFPSNYSYNWVWLTTQFSKLNYIVFFTTRNQRNYVFAPNL